MDQKELKIKKAKILQMKVPVKKNGDQDYNIYSIVTCMFILEFLNSLPEPSRDNPWPMEPINQNYKIRFQEQCDYLLGFENL